MKYSLLALFACASPCLPLRGQAPISAAAQANIAQNQTAKADARDSLKAGDSQGALNKLRAGVMQGAGAPSADAQVVIALCGIARSLAAEQHPAAGNTALLAVTEAEKAKGKSSPPERAYLAALSGEIYETTIGNQAKAREQYQEALALDPKRQDAVQGLWRIARLEALIQAKARENAALRSAGK